MIDKYLLHFLYITKTDPLIYSFCFFRMKTAFLHITDDFLRENLSLTKLLDSIEAGVECYSARSEGGVTQPLRTTIQDKPQTGHFGSSVAHIDCQNVYVNKMFSHVPANAERGLPVVHSTLAMFDSTDGHLVAIVDGAELTRLHQSSVAAAATRQLAPADASCLSLIVTSARDAEALLKAHRLVLNKLNKVHICAPRNVSGDAERFAAELRASSAAEGLEIVAFDSVEAAVAPAHVVCLSCGGPIPVLEASWLQQPGVHVNSLGSFLVSLREVSDSVVAKATLVVDSREAAEANGGDLRASGAAVSASVEVGELIGRRAKVDGGQTRLTLFSAVGLPVQDGMAARLALETMANMRNTKEVHCIKH